MELIPEQFRCKTCGYALDQCYGQHEPQLDRAKINKALDTLEAEIKVKKTLSDAQKHYIVRSIRLAVDMLIQMGDCIRSGEGLGYGCKLPQKTEAGEDMTHGARMDVMGVQDQFLAAGQGFSSLLFRWDVREDILYVIETFYGVSFSGLKVYGEAKNKLTGEKVYVAHNNSWDTNVSILNNGKYIGLTRQKFEEDYEVL